MKKLYLLTLILLFPILTYSTNPISKETYEESKNKVSRALKLKKHQKRVTLSINQFFENEKNNKGKKLAKQVLLFGILSVVAFGIFRLRIPLGGTWIPYFLFYLILPTIFSVIGFLKARKSIKLLPKNGDNKSSRAILFVGIAFCILGIIPALRFMVFWLLYLIISLFI